MVWADMQGLAHRIDYLADLGVTCLWLMPFYPTPDRDDGYDITPTASTHASAAMAIWWSSSERHATAACGSSPTWW